MQSINLLINSEFYINRDLIINKLRTVITLIIILIGLVGLIIFLQHKISWHFIHIKNLRMELQESSLAQKQFNLNNLQKEKELHTIIEYLENINHANKNNNSLISILAIVPKGIQISIIEKSGYQFLIQGIARDINCFNKLKKIIASDFQDLTIHDLYESTGINFKISFTTKK